MVLQGTKNIFDESALGRIRLRSEKAITGAPGNLISAPRLRNTGHSIIIKSYSKGCGPSEVA
jgi:hypothetical protein